ncbi:MAG: DUF2490 domain-containing protein [Sphingobacteriales bacterium]|nr:DUF2490 domain-containing protein [Sphingobacteriales bacterium]
MKFLYFLFILQLFNNSLFGQRAKLNQTALWFRHSVNLSLPKEMKLRSEIEYRLFAAPNVRTNQYLFRLIAEKRFKKNWTVGGGFVLFMNGSNDVRNTSRLFAPEPRPFIDIGYKQQISEKFNINHRYRTEWRFIKNTNTAYTELEDGFKDYIRFRYQVAVEYIPFKTETSDVRLRAFNEVMINAGKKVGRNIFDQNRTSFGVQYNINKYIGIEAAYIYWIQQQGNGDTFISRHIVRFGVINNFNISGKKPKS